MFLSHSPLMPLCVRSYAEKEEKINRMWESNRMTTASDEKKKYINTAIFFFFRSKSLGHTVAVDQMKEIGSARIADSSSFSLSL